MTPVLLLALFLVSIIHFEQCISQLRTPLTDFSYGSGNMPAAQGLLMSCYSSANNGIWLIDGGGTDIVWFFDLSTKLFTNDVMNYLTFTTTPVLNAQSYTQIDDILYFVYNFQVYLFDCTLGSVTSSVAVDASITGIHAPCVSNDGRYLFIASGEHDSNGFSSNDFAVYDTVGLSWTAGQDMDDTASHASCAVIGNYFYIYGGAGALTNVQRVYAGNPGSQGSYAWTQNWDTMNANNYHARSVTYAGLVYIVGGRDTVNDADQRISIMDDTGVEVSTVITNTARSSPCVIVVDYVMYVFGGGDTNDSITWEYSNVMTFSPTTQPTEDPTLYPTGDPMKDPTKDPTTDPTSDPTDDPTSDPSNDPTNDPIMNPTTNNPSNEPTDDPMLNPTTRPTPYNHGNTQKNGDLTIVVKADELMIIIICCSIIVIIIIIACASAYCKYSQSSKNKLLSQMFANSAKANQMKHEKTELTTVDSGSNVVPSKEKGIDEMDKPSGIILKPGFYEPYDCVDEHQATKGNLALETRIGGENDCTGSGQNITQEGPGNEEMVRVMHMSLSSYASDNNVDTLIKNDDNVIQIAESPK